MISNATDDANFSNKLLLADRQVSSTCTTLLM